MSLGGRTALTSTFHKRGWPPHQAVFTGPGRVSPGCFAFTRLTWGPTERHWLNRSRWVPRWHGPVGRQWPKGHTAAQGLWGWQQWHEGAWSLFSSSFWKCLWQVSPEGVWYEVVGLCTSRLRWKRLRPSCSDFYCDYWGSSCQEPFSDAQTPRGMAKAPLAPAACPCPMNFPVHSPDLPPSSGISRFGRTELF